MYGIELKIIHSCSIFISTRQNLYDEIIDNNMCVVDESYMLAQERVVWKVAMR